MIVLGNLAAVSLAPLASSGGGLQKSVLQNIITAYYIRTVCTAGSILYTVCTAGSTAAGVEVREGVAMLPLLLICDPHLDHCKT